MFDQIADKFLQVCNNLRRTKNITSASLDETLASIKTVLLEADVSLEAANSFLERTRTQLLGQTVIKGVSSSEMIIKLLNDQLEQFLGSEVSNLKLERTPSIIMMVGLQGSGKTTSSAKLAYYLTHKLQKKVLLVSLDVYRPAAREQLAVLAQQNDLASLEIDAKETNPLEIAKRALKSAKQAYYDVIIFDTAGRLQIDEKLMQELQQLHKLTTLDEIILVCDSLMGQAAVQVAQAFQATVPLSGIILTRMDSDSKGGAAISLKEATGCPIKFLGDGEKISDFSVFDPKRMASRILGMGDIVSLVEKAQEVVDEAEAKSFQKRLKRGELDLNDYLQQIKNLKKMGGLASIMSFIPGAAALKDKMLGMIDENEFKRQEAMIQSMTPAERSNPEILNSSRKRRIINGSATSMQELNHLLKRFKDAKRVIGQFGEHIDEENPPSLADLQQQLGGERTGNLQSLLQNFDLNKLN